MRCRYEVRVEQDGSPDEYHHYIVDADSPSDAEQIAFALDGGWESSNRALCHASGLLSLASAYCDIMSSTPQHQHPMEELKEGGAP